MHTPVPALDPHIAPYTLQIVGPQIDTERRAISDSFRSIDHPEFADPATRLADSFFNPELNSAYANAAPYVEHFISAELDTTGPKGPGIGKTLGGSSPEPSFGSRFRKGLSRDDAREEIGLCFERMVVAGFMGQLAYGGLNMKPRRTFDPDTIVATRAKYEEWVKYFPGLANQIFVKSMGLEGGPRGDAATEVYMWFKVLPTMTVYESVCKRLKIKGKIGTTGDREIYAVTCFAAGWLLGHLFSEVE